MIIKGVLIIYQLITDSTNLCCLTIVMYISTVAIIDQRKKRASTIAADLQNNNVTRQNINGMVRIDGLSSDNQ